MYDLKGDLSLMGLDIEIEGEVNFRLAYEILNRRAILMLGGITRGITQRPCRPKKQLAPCILYIRPGRCFLHSKATSRHF